MGRLKSDHIKRLITLTSDYMKQISLYLKGKGQQIIFLLPNMVNNFHQIDSFKFITLTQTKNLEKMEALIIFK